MKYMDDYDGQPIWYALLVDEDDDDWGTGTRSYSNALEWLRNLQKEKPNAYIAVIADGDDPICIDTIHNPDEG